METDWIMGLVGGLMIGLAASLYLLGNGRIMGASGIIGGLVDKSEWSSAADRIVFLIGLILAPSIYIFIFDFEADTKATTNVIILILAGLLVGLEHGSPMDAHQDMVFAAYLGYLSEV